MEDDRNRIAILRFKYAQNELKLPNPKCLGQINEPLKTLFAGYFGITGEYSNEWVVCPLLASSPDGRGI